MKQKTLIIIVIAVLALLAINGKDNFFSRSASTDQFVAPSWSRLECAPTDAYEGKQTVSIPKTGMSVFCGMDENTDACKVKISIAAIGNSDDKIRYTKCNNDGSNCQNKVTDTAGCTFTACRNNPAEFTLPALNAGEKYWIDCCEDDWCITKKECTAIKEYKPWKLYRFDDGAKWEQKATDCFITSPLKSFIPQKETMPNSLTMTGGEGSKWVNFVSGWNYVVPTGIVTYKGVERYCDAAQVFEIATLAMKDGTIKRVDPNYVAPDDTPNYVKTIGNRVAIVDCCPGETALGKFCNTDLEWETIPEENGDTCALTCWSDVQCSNTGLPIPLTAKTYKIHQCENDCCVWSEVQQVECTNNAACKSGEICDLSLKNYGKCITQTGAPYCGDKTCDLRTESNDPTANGYCPTDCGTQDKSTNYLPWILLGIALIVAAIILTRNKKGIRRRR